MFVHSPTKTWKRVEWVFIGNIAARLLSADNVTHHYDSSPVLLCIDFLSDITLSDITFPL